MSRIAEDAELMRRFDRARRDLAARLLAHARAGFERPDDSGAALVQMFALLDAAAKASTAIQRGDSPMSEDEFATLAAMSFCLRKA